MLRPQNMNIVQIFSSFGLQVLFRLFLECFLSLPAIPRLNGIWLAPREAQLEFSRILKYSIVLVILFIITLQYMVHILSK